MVLLKFEGIYFIEYGDEQSQVTRFFRFYPESFTVKSIYCTNGIYENMQNGLASTMVALDSSVPNPAITTAKYELDELYNLNFKLQTPSGFESFHGKLALDHSYLDMTITPMQNEPYKLGFFKFDPIEYVKYKELGRPYEFDYSQ
ncbi:MAG: hypothetical protein RIG77_17955 [Cyclobacteriaceae bacterium]